MLKMLNVNISNLEHQTITINQNVHKLPLEVESPWFSSTALKPKKNTISLIHKQNLTNEKKQDKILFLFTTKFNLFFSHIFTKFTCLAAQSNFWKTARLLLTIFKYGSSRIKSLACKFNFSGTSWGYDMTAQRPPVQQDTRAENHHAICYIPAAQSNERIYHKINWKSK